MAKIVDVSKLPTEKQKQAKKDDLEGSLRFFANSLAYDDVRKWMLELFGPEKARKRIQVLKKTVSNMDDFEKLVGKLFLAEDELQARIKSEVIDKLDKYRNSQP